MLETALTVSNVAEDDADVCFFADDFHHVCDEEAVEVLVALTLGLLMPERVTVCGPALEFRVKSARGSRVRGDVGGWTVTVNVRESGASTPSLRVTVMMALPLVVLLV